MSIDTRDKRFSMVGLGSPVPAVLPNPDGTIDAADRAMLLWLYHGITLNAPVAPVAIIALTLYARSLGLTLHERDFSLTLEDR